MVDRRAQRVGSALVLATVLTLVMAAPAQAADPFNVALGKRASGALPCTLASTPDKAVDGRWANIYTDKWCTVAPISWLRIDLGVYRSGAMAAPRYALNGFVVMHAGAAGESAQFNTRDFSIRVSADGVNWTTVAAITGNTANSTRITLPSPTSPVRYVDLNVTRPTQSLALLGTRIYELQAYGWPA